MRRRGVDNSLSAGCDSAVGALFENRLTFASPKLRSGRPFGQHVQEFAQVRHNVACGVVYLVRNTRRELSDGRKFLQMGRRLFRVPQVPRPPLYLALKVKRAPFQLRTLFTILDLETTLFGHHLVRRHGARHRHKQ